MTKPTKWHVRPAKSISLGILPVWSESSLSAWRKFGSLATHSTAKTLIRLGGCPGWSESSLGTPVILLVLSWGGSFFELNLVCSVPFDSFQDFEMSLLVLTHTCGVVIEDDEVHVKKSTNKYTTFFSQMFEPFLLGYWVTQLHVYHIAAIGHKCQWR